MPQVIVHAIKLGPSRFAMVDTTIKLIESIRDDFGPGLRTWDAFIYLLIVRRMWAMHQHGQLSSATGIANAIGMPRASVRRRLLFMETKLNAVERHGSRWALKPDFLNSPRGVEDLGIKGFKRRVARWHDADKKLIILGD